MSLITRDAEPTGLTTSINALERQLADMRTELEALYERIKAGEFHEIKHATKAIGEIRQWMKIALEAEAQLEKRRKTESGIAYDYAIDMQEARASIRFRLDRLRRARSTGRLPG